MNTIKLKTSGFFYHIYSTWYQNLPLDYYTYIRRLIILVITLPIYYIPLKLYNILDKLLDKLLNIISAKYFFKFNDDPLCSLMINAVGMILPLVFCIPLEAGMTTCQLLGIIYLSWLFGIFGYICIMLLIICFVMAIATIITIYNLIKKLYIYIMTPRGKQIEWIAKK